MHICQTCAGTRVVTITVANMQGPSKNRYQSSRQPYVTRNFRCYQCDGRGYVECPVCSDRGEIITCDAYGEYEGTEYCQCDAGRELLQSELEIQIERISHEAADEVRAAYLHHLNAPVEYGMTVAIDERPF